MVRRRIFLTVLAVAGAIAIFAVNRFDFWPPNHAKKLTAEREQLQQRRVEVGMSEADVRSRLGEPTEVEMAPFDFKKSSGAHRAPFRARKRLLYSSGSGERTTVFLDARGIVLEIDHSMEFKPVEL
jgi:hypothetical protein